MSIKVREIKEPRCSLFKDQIWVGTITSELQLIDVRVQIKDVSAEGYSVVYNNTTINIDKYGNLDLIPTGFYDQHVNLLIQLV